METKIINQFGGQYAEGDIINTTHGLTLETRSEYISQLMRFSQCKKKRTLLHRYATAKNYGFTFINMSDKELIDIYRYKGLIEDVIDEYSVKQNILDKITDFIKGIKK
ncbi:MAG: hypothetical protein ACRCXK_09285 [Wohlfahrtiimonas sp.]